MNSVFSFLTAGFCPKNLAFARKIVALPESGGLPQPPGSFTNDFVLFFLQLDNCSGGRTKQAEDRITFDHFTDCHVAHICNFNNLSNKSIYKAPKIKN